RFLFTFFFFSSRRRHTRFSRDWSSDVCSSDLPPRRAPRRRCGGRSREPGEEVVLADPAGLAVADVPLDAEGAGEGLVGQAEEERSEERRVGKERRARGGAQDVEKKKEAWSGGQ